MKFKRRIFAGISSFRKQVIDSMRPWATESMFAATIAGHIKAVDQMSIRKATSPDESDTARLKFCIDSLEEAQTCMTKSKEHANLHKGLLDFTQNLRNFPPRPSAAEQFKILSPLRGWLFWMPTSFLEMDGKHVGTLVCFAYFNATVLTAKPFFPAVGPVYFRNTQVSAIIEIYDHLVQAQMKTSLEGDESERLKMSGAVILVRFALEIAGDA